MRILVLAFPALCIALLSDSWSQQTAPDSVEVGYYRSGEKHWEIPYVHGRKHGTEIEWSESGAKKFETPYVDGKKHGTAVALYKSGKKRYEESYINGLKHGALHVWDENGNLTTTTWKNGVKVK